MITPAQEMKRLQAAKVLCLLDGDDLTLLAAALRHYEGKRWPGHEEEERLLGEMVAGVALAQVRQWRDRLIGENG